MATNDYRGGTEKSEYHNVVTWDRLAEICGQYLGKGQLVNIEGRIQTRQWEDESKTRHWKTEIVASAVEMLSGRRKRDYAAEAAAEALAAQAHALGVSPESGDDDDSPADESDAEEAVATQQEEDAQLVAA